MTARRWSSPRSISLLILEDLAADLRVRNPGREGTVGRVGRAAVVAVSDRIRQALTALIANAAKCSSMDSPVRLAAEQRVRPSACRWPMKAAAFRPQRLPRVFDRFSRVTGGDQRGPELSLAVIAAIVSAHGGRYGVESEFGCGSAFWIKLPAGPTGA